MPLTLPASLVSYPTGWRNLLHNGDMRISQRAITSTPSLTQSNIITDRWRLSMDNAGAAPGATLTCAPDTTVQAPGFPYNVLITCSGPDSSVAAGDLYCLQQGIEGFNVQQLMWGTTSARPASLSFWVWASAAGTYSGSVRSGTGARSFVFSFTLAAATFTKVTVAVPADTGGSVAAMSPGGAVTVSFNLGSGANFTTTNTGAWVAGNFVGVTGSFNWVGTAGATFRVTGVQFEIGNQVTPFEARPYGLELALCQRYFYIVGKESLTAATLSVAGQAGTSTSNAFNLSYPVTMAAVPVVTSSLVAVPWAPTTVGLNVTNRVGNIGAVSAVTANAASHNEKIADLAITNATGPTAGQSTVLYGNAAQAYLAFNAEI